MRIEWDKFEVALLIEACNQVYQKEAPRNIVIKELSEKLRKRAIEQGNKIDHFFRNENGIAMQMTKLEYLLSDGKSGWCGASKLYSQMVELYKSDFEKYNMILLEAIKQINLDENPTTSTDVFPNKIDQNITTCTDEISDKNESINVQHNYFYNEAFESILFNRFCSGMKFDSIDLENFREIYFTLYDKQLIFDDDTLEKMLCRCGVIYKDRLFPAAGIMDSNTKSILFSYIDACFASGKSVLYYKAIYDALAYKFEDCITLVDDLMLKAYIEYTADDGKYCFYSDYMSMEKNVKVDHSQEIEDFFSLAGKPKSIDEACRELSHIPTEQVEQGIKKNYFLVRNAKREYFHSCIFELSDDEWEDIAEIISRFIFENDYAIWSDVWNEIRDSLPTFVENNIYLSEIGIRNVISQWYINKFHFEKDIISLPGKEFTTKDIYQLYATHHKEFTAKDLNNLSKKLDTSIYFDAIYEVAIRVSYDQFVLKEMVCFDADKIDSAIDSFMSKDYIRIREIDSFISFPYVGHEWNEYILEGYLISNSKRFMLLNNGFSLNNVAGLIVKKDGSLKDFEDACAAVLSEGQVELKKNDALDYLAEVNVITNRRYKNIDSAILKAKQIRNRKV